MQPTPAEVARTLAAGRIAASAYVANRPGPYRTRHVSDALGRVLLLVPVIDDLALALRPVPGTDDTALVLDVRDLPPTAGAPPLGRAWISGWATALDGAEAQQAALDYAEIEPTGDLLDVGSRFVLYRFEPAEVRLEREGETIHVDPAEYGAAEPDPLHHLERELLADLADHHQREITEFVLRQLGESAGPHREGPPPRVVRLDRYGFVVLLGAPGSRYRARLAFPRPVRDHADLVQLLHPVLWPARHAQPERGRLHQGGPTAS
ncbi:DUF2470 domain-containing protein [Micromonospora sp. NPDC050417]|uniref:DUF2470 domain-containing protein n=1 Tax=Micromonospora sp. NPDC050417 TaxID=3364280 RepID=UPI0037B861BF